MDFETLSVYVVLWGVRETLIFTTEKLVVVVDLRKKEFA